MKIALKINSNYVCAEQGGGIQSDNGVPLIADRANQGIWEELKEIPLANGFVAFQTYDGFYITADDNLTGVSTNRTSIGIWENFKWVDNKIQTWHETFLNIDDDLVVIQKVDGIPIERIPLEAPLPPDVARRGIVVAEGKCAKDLDGLFHPLGITFFWGLYGYKFERERIHQHLAWMSQYPIDYLRILCEVDWPNRSINPDWPDYQDVLAGFIDTAYDTYGMRCELTLVGGHYADPLHLAHKVIEVTDSRPEKVIHYEVANEWRTLNKISLNDMIAVGKFLRQNTPNLVALSTPSSGNQTGNKISDMINYTHQAGCNMFTYHPRRSDHDNKWSAVRQGYDCKSFPFINSLNEPQGPQSSVASLDNPMQLAMARGTSVTCNGAFYVLHVAQGVTGTSDPNHGRPENMWEIPNIDECITKVCKINDYLPQGIENWAVKNNSSSSHPLPLDPRIGYGFWEGSSAGSVNKNYSCINGNKFIEVLLGVKNPQVTGMTLCGNARQDSHILSFDTNIEQENNISSGKGLYLRGRSDTMKGYVLNGNL